MGKGFYQQGHFYWKGAIILATSAVDKSIEGNGKVYFGTPPVEEARKKWRELAALKQLPDLLKTLQNQELKKGADRGYHLHRSYLFTMVNIEGKDNCKQSPPNRY